MATRFGTTRPRAKFDSVLRNDAGLAFAILRNGIKFFFVHFLDTLLHADKIRELKQRRRQRQRERQNSYRLRLAKQQLCTCITLFCTLLFHCHVKVPNLTFCRGRKHRTTFFFFFSPTLIQSFRIQLQKILPTFDEHIEQDGMSAIKFKAARTDVF